MPLVGALNLALRSDEHFQSLDYLHGQVGSAGKVVPRTFHGHEIGGRRNQGHGVAQLLQGTEGVFGAMDKKRWRTQIGEEGGTLVFRPLGWMERIRQQKQSGSQIGPFGR